MTTTDDTEAPVLEERPRAPVEFRSAAVADLSAERRTMTVIVAPYEQPTNVMWNGEVWQELFLRGAWAGIEGRPNRVRANRNHDKSLTVGKVTRFYPNRSEGLVADIKIAHTDRGDETLELAREDCLSVSAGFAALPADQIIDRRAKTRHIKTAYLDHISFVEDPAYTGAKILEVRENELIIPENTDMSFGPSPEEWLNDPIFLATAKYLG